MNIQVGYIYSGEVTLENSSEGSKLGELLEFTQV